MTWKRIVSQLIGAIGFAFAMSATQAATVSLVYTGANDVNGNGAIVVQVGDVLTFDIWFDFVDNPTIGGAFDTLWDTTVLDLVSYETAGLCDDPDCHGFDGPQEFDDHIQWSIGSFGDPISGGLFARMTFSVVGLDFADMVLALGPSTISADAAFYSASDFTPIDVEYNSIELASVPLPAAIWLMVGGLVALVGQRFIAG